MDKGKNRSDLLAAGRKKLQQYRQKKDGKGGGGEQQGRPSQTAGGKAGKAAGSGRGEQLREPEGVAASDEAELPAAAILARTLAGGDPVSTVDAGAEPADLPASCLRSNGDVEVDGDLGGFMPSASLDSHGKGCSSSDVGRSSSSCGGGDAVGVATQQDVLMVVAACDSSRVQDFGREKLDDRISMGCKGDPEGSVSPGDSQLEGVGDVISSLLQPSETDSLRPGSRYAEAGMSNSVLEATLGVGALVEVPADVAQDRDASLLNPGASKGDTMISHYEEDINVDKCLNGKDGKDQDAVTSCLSLTHSEDVEVSHNSVSDAHFAHQILDSAVTESQKGMMPSLGRMKGAAGLIYVSDIENETNVEIPEGRFVSHLEDRSERDNDSSTLSSDSLKLQRSMSLLPYILEESEMLKQHVFLTTFENHFMHRELEQQAADSLSSKEVLESRDSAQVSEEYNASICQELTYWRSEFHVVTSQKEEVELLLKSAKREIEALNARISELQTCMETSYQESAGLSAELSELTAKVVAIEKENLNMHKLIVMAEEEKKILEDEKEHLVSENMKLSRDLLEQNERLNLSLDQQTNLEKNLKESLIPLEKLSEENPSLSICLDQQRFKLKDLHGMLLLPVLDGFQHHASKDFHKLPGRFPLGSDKSIATVQKEKDLQVHEFDGNNVGDFGPFSVWKQHQQEATYLIRKLEETFQGMHSQSIPLSRLGGSVATPGISKLIVAFDMKEQPDYSITNETSLVDPAEDCNSTDLISFGEEQTKDLRKLLEEMHSDMENAFLVFKAQNENKICEEKNISEYEAQKLQNDILHAKIRELVPVLSHYKTIIDVFQNYIEQMSVNTDVQVECFLSQVEVIQKEIFSWLSSIERDRASIKDVVLQMIEKLDVSTGFLASGDDLTYSANASVDAATSMIKSLKEKLEVVQLGSDANFTCYEELRGDFANLKKFHDFAVEVLLQIHDCFRELNDGSSEELKVEDAFVQDYGCLEVIKKDSMAIAQQLKNLRHEQDRFLGVKEAFEEDLLKRSKTTMELEERCSSLEKDLENLKNEKNGISASLLGVLNDLQKLNSRCFVLSNMFVDSGTEILTDGAAASNSDILTAKNLILDSIDVHMSHIEASVVLFLQKFEEIAKEIAFSKGCLGEVECLANVSGNISSMPLHVFLKEEIIPKLMEMGQSQERLLSLNSAVLQKTNEIEFLNESLGKMEHTLREKCSEFELKVVELEQSEQKISSVREKLSIAVAKGKGLVVQRDNLKQSLVEKTSELEKCLQELQTKEMMLHEVEAKLKSYSEVDRVEALESELSYIRNSATAFRDSFLLKDSMLQRIEEILENLDLPEYFHSKDTVEKIQLLAKSVASNSSFMVTDWDQRAPIGELHSDELSAVVDALKEDQAADSISETDELKRRFDELQRKFYGLAEHNDMLEQSLMERHSIIQRWEELLDMIDMPEYLRSMEPVVRLEWLGKALPEVQREHNSLLAKVGSFAESNESLIGNLQEMQEKISELEAALLSAERERESLSILANELRLENSELSDEKSQNAKLLRRISELETVLVSVEEERLSLSVEVNQLRLELSNVKIHNEVEKAQLQKDISDFQEQLAESISNNAENQILERVKDIQILFDDAVPENDGASKSLSDDPIYNLEMTLKRLVDDYKALLTEKSMNEHSAKLSDCKRMADEQVMKDLLDNKEKDIIILKTQLDEASESLMLLKEELFATVEKHRLVLTNLEKMDSQKKILLEDKESMSTKCQDLEMELLTLKTQLDNTSRGMALLAEEKNALVEDKCALQLNLEELIKHRDSLFVDKEDTLEKCRDLRAEVESLTKQRDTLMEQLTQEEQRSSSVREKLNVAVRKGKGLVQQRDGLKQAVEEMNTKVEQLETQLNHSASENSSLRNMLAQTESILQDNKQMVDGILIALHEINEVPPDAPVQMLEGIQKLLNDRLKIAQSKEQEAKKSRKAAELLLAELNEVQERADSLQEELSKAEITLAECFKERDEAKIAKADALSKLEQVIIVHSKEREKEDGNILLLRSRIDEFRNGWLSTLDFIWDIFSKYADFVNSLEISADCVLQQVNGTSQSNRMNLPSRKLLSRGLVDEDKSHNATHKGQSVSEHLYFANESLYCCLGELGNLNEIAQEYYAVTEQKARAALMILEVIQREITFLGTSSEPLSSVVNRLEISKTEKGTEISKLERSLVLLVEACKNSILQIEAKQSRQKGPAFESEITKAITSLPICIKADEAENKSYFPFTEDHIQILAGMLLSSIRGFEKMYEEIAEDKHKRLKSRISDLQQELQEKDIQSNRINAELVSQIHEAESLAKKLSGDLESLKEERHDLENHLKVVEDEKKFLEEKVKELNNLELSSKDLNAQINSLSELIMGKDQEIEALMQALDEEELQMETMQSRIQALEKLLEEKAVTLDSLEASRAKSMMKLSTTVDKFDELHQLSENLLVEVENLQSQLQERDSEISFLRQEVTRCTKDVIAEQESYKKASNNLHELQKWIFTMFTRFAVPDADFENQAGSQFGLNKEVLDEKLSAVVAEFNDLQVNSQNKDVSLQIERGRVHELLQKVEALETSLHDRESQIELYQRTRDSGQVSTADSSEPREIESLRNKGATSSSVVPLIRSGRKIIGDHVSVDLDLEQGYSLEDEDDDKAHGFRSLTMSKVVPKFTRPVAERIDGLWVSIERLLMRQPSLRLGLIIYWIILHAVLAASI